MAEPRPASGVLLVGSIPLSSAEEVFRTAFLSLPGRLSTVPDGETGERLIYVMWQASRFPAEARRILPYTDGVELPANHPGFTQESVKPTGYDDAAIESYQKFAELKSQGVIPPNVRFQVCLPHPLDTVQFFVRNEFHETMSEYYGQRMREAVKRIVDNIPNDQLAIQWDIATLCPMTEMSVKGREPTFVKEYFQPSLKAIKEGFLSRLAALCDVIPPEVQVGLHFCYGDLQHKHVIEPEDTGIMTEMINAAIKEVKHSIQWVHLPVPKGRDDAAYFEPLRNLDIGDTALYLGLVHAEDEEGTKKRMATAQGVGVKQFGVATECGFGRTPKEQVEGILRISAAVSGPVVAN